MELTLCAVVWGEILADAQVPLTTVCLSLFDKICNLLITLIAT
jgi:hypothetical protein